MSEQNEIEFPPNDLLASHGAVRFLLGESVDVTEFVSWEDGEAWEFAVRRDSIRCRVIYLLGGLSVVKGKGIKGGKANCPMHAAQIVKRYLS